MIAAGRPARRTLPLFAAAFAMFLLSLVLVPVAPAVADTAPPTGTPATVSADGLPTWQINGVVWSQAVVGNTVYVTGSFTKARPPGVSPGGAGEIAANNIFAYDITTGNPVASFSHSLNAQGLVITASPDGSRIYVGGDFTTVDGIARSHIAAFDTATGALDTTFVPTLSNQVRGIAVSPTTVYVGGSFFNASGKSRTRLAAFATSGALLSWAPKADDNNVAAMVMTPDNSRVIVGGSFTTLNGVSANGMGSLDATTGATEPWAANQVMRDGGTGSGITSLTTDGTQIYGSGYAYQTGSFEGSFAAAPLTGAIAWLNDCHGDTYDTFPVGQALYTVSHAHNCQPIGAFPQTADWTVNQRRALAFTTYATGHNTGPDDYGWNYNGQPDSSILQWYPVLSIGSYTGQAQAAWAVDGNSNYVVLGGEFPKVNGVAQQGLVRFATRTIAPNKRGPEYNNVAPTAAAQPSGGAKVSWKAQSDQDNAALTYKVYRSGTTAPIYTTTQNSNYWTMPAMSYVDNNVAAGTYTYQVQVSDPFGNVLSLPKPAAVTVTGTVANKPPVAAFTSTVNALAASFNGSTSADPDGSIASYSWNFGDSTAPGSGAAASHTYGAAGTYHVTLTVTDNGGSTNSVTHDVTVAPPNQPPVAAFTSSVNALAASFNGSTSADPDGSIASYSWNFGDSTAPGSGAITTHTYAAVGTYHVTLTVTDNSGATNSVTHDVTATAGVTVVASDTFGRTVANGWGSADSGGVWTPSGTATNFAVNGGAGKITMGSAGAGPSEYLNSVSTTDTDLQVAFSANKASTGNGTYFYFIGRKIASVGDYRAKVRILSNGTVGIAISKFIGSTETATVPEKIVPGLTYTAGQVLQLRFDATGTSPTTLGAKVWASGTTEPTGWQISATDATASLQVAGGVGLAVYLSGSSTSAPVVGSFQNLKVSLASTLPPAAAAKAQALKAAPLTKVTTANAKQLSVAR
ncbi:MAG TPA: PKD domain-containing protein [Mycobacteriales bacterium]|nr:PKD domain-containing protein [Mycobacteriales bacterium]